MILFDSNVHANDSVRVGAQGTLPASLLPATWRCNSSTFPRTAASTGSMIC